MSNNGNTAAKIMIKIGDPDHEINGIMVWLHNNPIGVTIVVVLPISVLVFVVLTVMKRCKERAD